VTTYRELRHRQRSTTSGYLSCRCWASSWTWWVFSCSSTAANTPATTDIRTRAAVTVIRIRSSEAPRHLRLPRRRALTATPMTITLIRTLTVATTARMATRMEMIITDIRMMITPSSIIMSKAIRFSRAFSCTFLQILLVTLCSVQLKTRWKGCFYFLCLGLFLYSNNFSLFYFLMLEINFKALISKIYLEKINLICF
jgi:hypothetical protein